MVAGTAGGARVIGTTAAGAATIVIVAGTAVTGMAG
jgi:hypothetical protein